MNTQSKNNSHEDANITQFLATVFPVFITFFTLKNVGVHWIAAAGLAGLVGVYYLRVCWNHTSGIPAKPKRTITALVAAIALPAVLMVIGLPLVLGNILLWAIFPWTQRYFFERDKDSRIPPPSKVDIDTA